MENDVYQPIVAVTTDVAIFYDPPAESAPDEFVLPDAPEVEPVILPLVDMAVAAEYAPEETSEQVVVAATLAAIFGTPDQASQIFTAWHDFVG